MKVDQPTVGVVTPPAENDIPEINNLQAFLDPTIIGEITYHLREIVALLEGAGTNPKVPIPEDVLDHYLARL